MDEKEKPPSLTDKFCGAYRALFNYGIGKDSVEEWENQILLKYGHSKATDAIRRLATRGVDHSPTIMEVRKEILSQITRVEDATRHIPCSCCHADGGYMTFGLVGRRDEYPDFKTGYACGYSGWCPPEGDGPHPFTSDFALPPHHCMVHGNTEMVCIKSAIACKCSVGEALMQTHINRGTIKEPGRYQSLRDRVNDAIRRRLGWESGRDDGQPVPIDMSAANAVSVEMIKKFQ